MTGRRPPAGVPVVGAGLGDLGRVGNTGGYPGRGAATPTWAHPTSSRVEL